MRRIGLIVGVLALAVALMAETAEAGRRRCKRGRCGQASSACSTGTCGTPAAK